MSIENQSAPPDFQKVPVLGAFAKKFDQLVGSLGLQAASREAVRLTGTKFRVTGLTPELQRDLLDKPCLVVSNHRFDVETLAVFAALPSRSDTYVIASHNQIGFGVQLAKHIIPVYIRGDHEAGDVKMSVRIARRMRFRSALSDADAHELNLQSISHAARLVSDGHQVVIFPEGSGGKEGKWRNGIGYLIQQITNRDALLVCVNVTGTSELDIFRLLPGAAKLLPMINVQLSPSIPISELSHDLGPKQTVLQLRDFYNNSF